MTKITDTMFTVGDIGGEAAIMFLPHFIDALLAFYGALFLLFAYCACKPSCRMCAHRHICPMRLRGMPQLLQKPICTMPHSGRPVSRPAPVPFRVPSDADLRRIYSSR